MPGFGNTRSAYHSRTASHFPSHLVPSALASATRILFLCRLSHTLGRRKNVPIRTAISRLQLMSLTMHSNDNSGTAVLWIAGFGCSYVVYKAVSIYLAPISTLHTLRGPDSPSWLFGNAQVTRVYRNSTLESWMREYGSVFAIHSFFGTKALLISDPKAASFVLNRPNEFPKVRELPFNSAFL